MSQRFKDYISRIIVVMLAVGLVAGFLFTPGVYRADGLAAVGSFDVPFSYSFSDTVRVEASDINFQEYLGDDGQIRYSSWSYFTISNIIQGSTDYVACKVTFTDVVFEYDTDLRGAFYYNICPQAEYNIVDNAMMIPSNNVLRAVWLDINGDNRYYSLYMYYEIPFNYLRADYVDFSISGTAHVQPYTDEMLLSEFWDVLKPYIDNLESIENVTLTQVQALVTQANNIYAEQLEQGVVLDNLYSITQLVNANLDSIESYLKSMDSELEKQTGFLVSIFNTLSDLYDAFLDYTGLGSDKDVEEMDTESVSDAIDLESNLIGSGPTSDQIAEDVTVNIDINANAAIWDIINDSLMIHPDVFGFVLSMLGLGVVALILGR